MNSRLLAFALLLSSAAPVLHATDVEMTIDVAGTERKVLFRLDQQVAPKTSENFAKLCREGFYDGISFHRVIPGYVVQGGDPLTKEAAARAKWGTGGPGYTIPAELGGKHVRGALAASRLGDQANPKKESSGSQFYVVLRDIKPLDGQYTVFGRIVSGLEAFDEIASAPSDESKIPTASITIKSTRVIEVEAPAVPDLTAKEAPVIKLGAASAMPAAEKPAAAAATPPTPSGPPASSAVAAIEGNAKPKMEAPADAPQPAAPEAPKSAAAMETKADSASPKVAAAPKEPAAPEAPKSAAAMETKADSAPPKVAAAPKEPSASEVPKPAAATENKPADKPAPAPEKPAASEEPKPTVAMEAKPTETPAPAPAKNPDATPSKPMALNAAADALKPTPKPEPKAEPKADAAPAPKPEPSEAPVAAAPAPMTSGPAFSPLSLNDAAAALPAPAAANPAPAQPASSGVNIANALAEAMRATPAPDPTEPPPAITSGNEAPTGFNFGTAATATAAAAPQPTAPAPPAEDRMTLNTERPLSPMRLEADGDTLARATAALGGETGSRPADDGFMPLSSVGSFGTAAPSPAPAEAASTKPATPKGATSKPAVKPTPPAADPDPDPLAFPTFRQGAVENDQPVSAPAVPAPEMAAPGTDGDPLTAPVAGPEAPVAPPQQAAPEKPRGPLGRFIRRIW